VTVAFATVIAVTVVAGIVTAIATVNQTVNRNVSKTLPLSWIVSTVCLANASRANVSPSTVLQQHLLSSALRQYRILVGRSLSLLMCLQAARAVGNAVTVAVTNVVVAVGINRAPSVHRSPMNRA
jgi:hypothetical protein